MSKIWRYVVTIIVPAEKKRVRRRSVHPYRSSEALAYQKCQGLIVPFRSEMRKAHLDIRGALGQPDLFAQIHRVKIDKLRDACGQTEFPYLAIEDLHGLTLVGREIVLRLREGQIALCAGDVFPLLHKMAPADEKEWSFRVLEWWIAKKVFTRVEIYPSKEGPNMAAIRRVSGGNGSSVGGLTVRGQRT